jgi:eukaryotic-like serine/threonine-protein kinase
MPLAPGTKLGLYDVVAQLGAGGMGEVYRARDTTLGREVAIKVLPALLSQGADRLRRFQQEARAAAALNHPNILAVFQLGTHDGNPYLVSELLEGGTLREQLMRGRMPLRKAIDCGIQVAHGLAAAHDKGIVHRDLKPENLFVTKDGRVKILDFGLAKLTAQSTASDRTVSAAAEGTEAGMVMGTVGYMAPEQVRGEKADHRSDIFALGAILYEMLTGQRAFRKATSAETMSAILNEDPSAISQILPGIPPALHKIVHRCLDKNPEQRFQSASDLAFALEALSESGTSAITAQRQPVKSPRRWMFAVAAGVIVIAAVLALVFLRHRSALISPSEWVQITNFADSVTSPAFSPDGRMLTFLRGEDTFVTAGQVYVMLLPQGNPSRLTDDAMMKMSPVFSPDGSTIDYTVPWDTWSVPILGGKPQLWLPNASGLTWLDADKLMYSQITSGNHMEVVSSDLSRANVHHVYTPKSTLGMAHRSYLSPDRKWAIAVEMTGNFWERCRLIPSDGSTLGVAIGPLDGVCKAAAWSPDGNWMYINSNSGHAFHIWQQRFPAGQLQQVTSGPTEEEGIAIAPDGNSLITSVGMRRSSVWLHDAHGDRVLTSEATAVLGDPRNGSPFSPDGKKLYYLITRTPGREVSSEMAIGELSELELQSGASRAVMPGFSISDFSLSPDSSQIAFTAMNEDGAQSIWVAALDRSSSPRLLQTSAEHPRFVPGFIYYIKRGPNGSFVHRMRLDGSGDEQLWNQKVITVATSPDGRYLAVTVPGEKPSVWQLEIVDWAQKRVQPVCADAIAYWSDDAKSLIVVGGFGKAATRAPSYIISLAGTSLPALPAKGLSNITQLAELPHVRVVPERLIGPGRSPDTYVYIKTTVQRNLYRIPLH